MSGCCGSGAAVLDAVWPMAAEWRNSERRPDGRRVGDVWLEMSACWEDGGGDDKGGGSGGTALEGRQSVRPAGREAEKAELRGRNEATPAALKHNRRQLLQPFFFNRRVGLFLSATTSQDVGQ